MKTIMCYGDSLTWGYNPADGTHYPFEQRWPGVLQIHFLDASRTVQASTLDGVHLDSAGQRALASEVKKVVTAILTGG